MLIRHNYIRMTKLHEVYKCEVCGNIVEMLHTGVGQLICCGQPMQLQAENTVDAATEKHVPVATQTEQGVKVVVGSELHPMENDHYIEWIEVITGAGSLKHFLKPGDNPEVEIKLQGEIESVREYCNLHGLWKTDQIK